MDGMRGSVRVPTSRNWLRRMLAFAGPAYLVSVGYMDPGNWATDIAGGSRFGYQLAWVLLMSNLMAVLLQTLSARLGVVSGRDLAQACRERYPRWVVMPLWLLCEVAIVACDLAEVLGAAIGLQLLTGLPLLWGVLLTALDVMLLLLLSHYGVRRLEAFILALVATIGVCFALQTVLSRPDLPALFAALVPRDASGAPSLFAPLPGGGHSLFGLHGESLFLAMGILGATVMPHNLYLHSALVQSREVEPTDAGRAEACRMNLVDSVVALNAALLVNGGILVLAAATFHRHGHLEVASLHEAHRLLEPLLGGLSAKLFAVALLCAGQASTITGTLAGQIVLEGFLRVRLRPWLRRSISRGLALVPAVAVIATRGERGADELLVLSQVVLSLQLPFAVLPLVAFTSDRELMGRFANPSWVRVLAGIVSALIVALNLKLAWDTVGGWLAASPHATLLAWTVLPAVLVTFAFTRRGRPRVPAVGGAVPLGSGGAGAVLRPGTAEWNSGQHRRIAVALELEAADGNILGFLDRATFAPGATLVLVHVAESAASRWLGERSLDRESREDAAALDALAERFRSRGIAVEVRLGHGEPVREIARLVRESDADLLVTGSHGHSGLSDVVFGATVSGVRHRVACPVLTVPPFAAEQP
jgi:manganese transport protein